jgi:hypothetical protein
MSETELQEQVRTLTERLDKLAHFVGCNIRVEGKLIPAWGHSAILLATVEQQFAKADERDDETDDKLQLLSTRYNQHVLEVSESIDALNDKVEKMESMLNSYFAPCLPPNYTCEIPKTHGVADPDFSAPTSLGQAASVPWPNLGDPMRREPECDHHWAGDGTQYSNDSKCMKCGATKE